MGTIKSYLSPWGVMSSQWKDGEEVLAQSLACVKILMKVGCLLSKKIRGYVLQRPRSGRGKWEKGKKIGGRGREGSLEGAGTRHHQETERSCPSEPR